MRLHCLSFISNLVCLSFNNNLDDNRITWVITNQPQLWWPERELITCTSKWSNQSLRVRYLVLLKASLVSYASFDHVYESASGSQSAHLIGSCPINGSHEQGKPPYAFGLHHHLIELVIMTIAIAIAWSIQGCTLRVRTSLSSNIFGDAPYFLLTCHEDI